MPLMSINSAKVRPEATRRYEQLCQEFSRQCRQKQEKWHWTAHQTMFGEVGMVYFATECADFKQLAELGTLPELILRVAGEKQGERILAEAGGCLAAERHEVSIDRPELSYPMERTGRTAPAAVVTVVHARPGQQEACEELIRKVAEAIPKVGDPVQIVTYQTILGDLSQYWTVRPLEDIADLDQQRTPQELLDRAFGPAEGGLIFRNGLDAIEKVQRNIVLYRGDMSNPA